MHPLLDDIRLAELSAAEAFLPPAPARVLEVGAGSGWQSSLLAAKGYDVTSVDVSPPPDGALVPVLPIDGVSLPFATNTFDVVFSSNVLEHVVDLTGLLAEADRVLRPAGWSVHVVPTPTWRVLTMLTFYMSLPSRVLGRLRANQGGGSSELLASDTAVQRTIVDKLRSMLWEPPHGEFPSAAAEIWSYRAGAWRRRFLGSLLAEQPAGVVYTGYGLVPSLSLRRRRSAARVLGSACRIYVVQPTSDG